MFINSALAVMLAEGSLECWGFDSFALRHSENFKWCSLLVVPKTMRPMRQAIVIADQFAVKVDSGGNRSATFPMVFTNTRLNSKLAFNQVLPRVAFLVHFMT